MNVIYRENYAPSDFNGLNPAQLITKLRRIRKEQRKAQHLGVHPVHIRVDMREARECVMRLARTAKETGTLSCGAGFLLVWSTY